MNIDDWIPIFGDGGESVWGQLCFKNLLYADVRKQTFKSASKTGSVASWKKTFT
jgi:hypothetical protein